MECAGHRYRSAIDNGTWVVEDVRYKSPSNAAGSVARTLAGTTTRLNGWAYWVIRRPGAPD